MAYGKMKKGYSKGYGSKRMSYNGMVKPIMGTTKRTDPPAFRDYSPGHGTISNIAHYSQIGG